ncbi:GNAT family N-acetyltransferase [Oceanobacillus sp. CFH 90083]|uniref:GNAT family N-acetyltransferase n=1 Tax=Oceanobacillus sp. CFH 90083 TaxID=2592336 RepID=UPI00128E5BF3|nr:GNAT family N-acetyltransferase [Oceanobacillus sp. CFH 90083]
MISIKSLEECTLAEAAEAGNKGFEDYYVSIKMTPERLIHMLSSGNMSPEFSFVAFVEGKPAGMMLNGIQTINEVKTAWNGATAVNPAFRGISVGNELMKAAMQLLEKEKVHVATLECFRVNKKAIKMYEKFGYEVQEELMFLQHTESLAALLPLHSDIYKKYEISHCTPQDVSRLTFYQHSVPWKTQWANIRNGEALIVQDDTGLPAGYALYERVFDHNGNLRTIMLYQCVCVGEHQEEVIKLMLNRLYSPLDQDCKRMTFNMPSSNKTVKKLLMEANFHHAETSEGVPLSQYYMTKELY